MTIPIHLFDIGKVVVSTPQRGIKLIAPLSYVDGDTHFTSLSISLSSLPVKSYDSATGQLQVYLQGSKDIAKLQQLQDMLIQTVITNQRGWFTAEKSITKDDIRAGFQPFVDHGTLHLYYPTTSDNIGQNVRIALRIQGLSFHQHHITKAWTGKFRLQHRILDIL